MGKSRRLDPARHEFFELVARAAYLNPFGEERRKLDLQLADCGPQVPADEVLRRLVARVSDMVGHLEAAGHADLRLYEGKARETLQGALLFETYHRFLDPVDQLIHEQVRAGDAPCRVPFSRDVLSQLCRRGVPPADALRFLAIFYQLRRAYYFIDRGLVGRGPSMAALRRHLWDNVFTHDIGWYERRLWNRLEDFSTLLLGETGTGKGAAAAAIGRSGFIPFDERKGTFAESFARNFLSINLSQYPESLIESELFGHRKGAFTGAIDSYQGVLAGCSPHGAIFLDEIGDVSAPVQIKLLQVLQERTFSPVGSHERLRFQGRVIAATNRSLSELREKGQFREDFYYRLCSDMIEMPTLRQRLAEDPDELPDLVSHIVTRLAGEAVPQLVALVLEVVAADLPAGYPWPGNVRELEQAVRRILLTRHYRGEVGAKAPATYPAQPAFDARDMLAEHCARLYGELGSFQEVARRTGLDRRTVRKHVLRARGES